MLLTPSLYNGKLNYSLESLKSGPGGSGLGIRIHVLPGGTDKGEGKSRLKKQRGDVKQEQRVRNPSFSLIP